MTERHHSTSAPASTKLAVAALALVWGSTWLGIKVSLAHASPLRALALRFVVAAAGLAAWRPGKRARRRTLRDWRRSLGLALLTFVLPYALVYWGELHISSGLASVLFSTQSLVVAALAPIMSDERTTPGKWAGVGLGLLGLAVMFHSRMGLTGAIGVLGGIAVLGAAASAAAGLVAMHRCGEELDALPETAAQLAISAALFIIAALVEPGHIDWPSPALWLSVAYLGLVGTAAAFALYFWLAIRAPALLVSLSVLTCPVVAVLLGWVVAGEPVDLVGIAGAALVLCSVALTSD